MSFLSVFTAFCALLGDPTPACVNSCAPSSLSTLRCLFSDAAHPSSSSSSSSSSTGVASASIVLTWNSQLQYDTSGALINAHAGGIYNFNGIWHMYGDVYDDCMQGQTSCQIGCGYYGDYFSHYTSPDFVHWTMVSMDIYPTMDGNNEQYYYFTPNVGYNAFNGLYYLTWTGQQYGGTAHVPFATSTTPNGPFVFAGTATLTNSTAVSSTCVLFVDPADGRGYVRYNAGDSPKRHMVEQLSNDWLSTTGQYALLYLKPDYPWFEGGAFFERDGTYYNTIGTDCCYCQWGASALVFTAPSPLGPWTMQNDINPCSGDVEPDIHLGSPTTNVNPCTSGLNFTTPGQQFNAVNVNGQYLYYGEQFFSAGDGQKWHDLQIMQPMTFSGTSILTMTFTRNVSVPVASSSSSTGASLQPSSSSSSSSASLSPSPLVWYSPSSFSSGVWHDVSGNGYNTVIQSNSGMAPTAVAGGGGLAFNGSQWLQGPSVFPVATNYTLWLVFSTAGCTITCVMVGSPTQSHAFYMKASVFTVAQGAVFEDMFGVSPQVAVNQTTLAAVVFSSASTSARLYINGTYAGLVLGFNMNAGSDLAFGQWNSQYFFSGVIYEFQLFASALTATQLGNVTSTYSSMWAPGSYTNPSPTSYITHGVLASFETPVVTADQVLCGQTFNHTYQPWNMQDSPIITIGSQACIGTTGSSFDPTAPTTPPNGVQYAVLQPTNMQQVTMVTTVVGAATTLSFYYGISSSDTSTLQLVVAWDTLVVWTSAVNITSSGGWTQVTSVSLPTSSSPFPLLSFTAVPYSTQDQAVLIDAVLV